ncbi:MAG TPA: YicC/YloC family endoribonuclease [Chitinivibrionales bacterium]
MPLRSMTGFGLAEASTPSGTYRIEIRGVNNRFLDVQIRQPRYFANIEQKIKKEISECISRGSVSVYIASDTENEAGKLTWDEAAVKNYIRIFKEIKKACSLSGEPTLTDLLHFSDLIKTTSVKLDDKTLLKHVLPVLTAALDGYQKSREAEGAATIKEFKKLIDAMLSVLKRVEQRAPERLREYSQELTKKIEKLTGQSSAEIDAQRLVTEVAIMADRLDISEECMRLRAHIEAFIKDFKSPEPVGKRMNFVVQEMNREANTIGSKANDAVISHLSITLKELIEKIREQIQNVE